MQNVGHQRIGDDRSPFKSGARYCSGEPLAIAVDIHQIVPNALIASESVVPCDADKSVFDSAYDSGVIS